MNQNPCDFPNIYECGQGKIGKFPRLYGNKPVCFAPLFFSSSVRVLSCGLSIFFSLSPPPPSFSSIEGFSSETVCAPWIGLILMLLILCQHLPMLWGSGRGNLCWFPHDAEAVKEVFFFFSFFLFLFGNKITQSLHRYYVCCCFFPPWT